MRSWLHDAASKPYIKKKFSQLKLDDRLLELTYSLNNPSDQESDDDFVINIFAQYMVIGWLKPQVDNAINTAINQLLVLTRLKHLMVLIFVINQEIHPIQILSLQSLMENLLQIMDTTLPSMESNGILLHTKIHLDLFPVGILLNDSTAHNE